MYVSIFVFFLNVKKMRKNNIGIFFPFWECILLPHPSTQKSVCSLPCWNVPSVLNIFYHLDWRILFFSTIFGLYMTLQCCLFCFSSHVMFVSASPGTLLTVRCWVSGGYPGVQSFFMHKLVFKNVINLLWYGQYWLGEKSGLKHVK